MISRRRIISRSQEVLNDSNHFNPYEFEDNVWNSKEKLFRDHIQEILNKWEQIDDEIWAKIICMEKNRRVAKAYARAQVLSINGSDLGFDGYRIGLNGFQNPQRDSRTQDVKRYIGSGAKVKIDEEGNILIKRIGKCSIYANPNSLKMTDVNNTADKSNYLNMSPIEIDKSVKLFDIKRFQSDVNREMRNSYPDRRKLESQCISCISFVIEENNILEHPVWVMLINIVAMDMLKAKFPISTRMPKFMTVFEESMLEKDENQQNFDKYKPKITLNRDSDTSLTLTSSSSASSTSRKDPKTLPENENYGPTVQKNRGLDDLYYCGFQARVPNFARQRSSLAIYANNANLEPRKLFNSSLQLSSLTNDITRKPINGNYDLQEDNLESLDVIRGRAHKKQVKTYPITYDNYVQQNFLLNRNSYAGNWKNK